MAISLNAGDFNRTDMFLIDPKEVLVDQKLNGRWKPHTQADIDKRTTSFEQDGQLTPVTVRRLHDKRVQLIAGYCRHAAALTFNERHPDKPMQLKCVISQVNDEEAFRKNIVENRERKETTVVDDAHNQRRFREDHGWTDAKIAQYYQMSEGYVCQLKKLLLLPTSVQEQIHDKTLSLEAGLHLADLDQEDQNEILKDAPKDKKRTKAIKKAARKKKQKKGKALARTLSELRDYFESLTGPAESPEVSHFAKNVLNFINGKLADDDMDKIIKSVLPPLVVTGNETQAA